MSEKNNLKKIILMGLIILATLSIKAKAVTYVNTCRNLDTAGETYVMNQSINNAGQDCIKFTADNITFDCKGYTIDGTGSYNGIYSNGNDNSVIRNCVIQEFSTGVYLNGVNNVSLVNVSARSGSYGWYVYISSNVSVINSSARGFSSYGLYLSGSSDVSVVGNNFSDNSGTGAGLFGTGFFNVSNNWVVNNSGNGLRTGKFPYTSFFNNTACNNSDYDFYSYGQGYFDDGVERVCSGLGVYRVEGGGVCKAWGGSGSVACEGSEGALNDGNCTNIYLTTNITNYVLSQHCIDNPSGFAGKVFDCKGLMIDGTGSYSAFYLSYGRDNNVIRNCVIQEFSTGVYLKGVDNVSLVNVSARLGSYGFDVRSSSNVSVINSSAREYSSDGLYVQSSSDVSVVGNNFSDNQGIGMYFGGGCSGFNVSNNIVVNSS